MPKGIQDMSQNPLARRRRGWLPGVITAGALVAVAACSAAKENLLTAVDPDLIDPTSVQSTEGANAIRIGALSRFRDATAGYGAVLLLCVAAQLAGAALIILALLSVRSRNQIES